MFNANDQILSPEEQFMEYHFQETYTVNYEGRFVGKLSFYKSKPELRDSRSAVISRLLAIEKKFKENPKLCGNTKILYSNVNF